MVRKTIFLTGFGFATVLFIGPLLTLAVVILTFVCVGFLLWLPLHTLVYGERRPWRPYTRMGQGLCRAVSDLRDQALAAIVSLRRPARLAGLFLVESCSGAAVGALLALLRGPEPTSSALLIGAGIGAALGALAALAQPAEDP